MLTFPLLNSGAVAQYPERGSTQFNNQVLSFLDGGEQRFRLAAGPLHRWVVQLALLDDSELTALELFVGDTQGAFELFSFTDPEDDMTYANCYLTSDSLDSIRDGDLRGSTTLEICEERTF
jgi:hypothetical protein